MKPKMSSSNDTVYLCNFRVSVNGDWLCLKELHDLQTSEISSIPARFHYFKQPYGAFYSISLCVCACVCARTIFFLFCFPAHLFQNLILIIKILWESV